MKMHFSFLISSVYVIAKNAVSAGHLKHQLRMGAGYLSLNNTKVGPLNNELRLKAVSFSLANLAFFHSYRVKSKSRELCTEGVIARS